MVAIIPAAVVIAIVVQRWAKAWYVKVRTTSRFWCGFPPSSRWAFNKNLILLPSAGKTKGLVIKRTAPFPVNSTTDQLWPTEVNRP